MYQITDSPYSLLEEDYSPVHVSPEMFRQHLEAHTISLASLLQGGDKEGIILSEQGVPIEFSILFGVIGRVRQRRRSHG